MDQAAAEKHWRLVVTLLLLLLFFFLLSSVDAATHDTVTLFKLCSIVHSVSDPRKSAEDGNTTHQRITKDKSCWFFVMNAFSSPRTASSCSSACTINHTYSGFRLNLPVAGASPPSPWCSRVEQHELTCSSSFLRSEVARRGGGRGGVNSFSLTRQCCFLSFTSQLPWTQLPHANLSLSCSVFTCQIQMFNVGQRWFMH